MANKVFLMAQGKGSRWTDKLILKQCIPIGGRPIIDRTIEMIPDNFYATLVSPGDVLNYIVAGRQCAYTYFKEPGSLLKGIWLCRNKIDIGTDNVLILLGDVVFSRKMSHLIFSKEWEEITLFGRVGENKVTGKAASELFALWIPSNYAEEFFREIKIMWISLYESGKEGKLWNLSREFHYPIKTVDDDYTDDIDSPEEYMQFYEALNEAAIMDDMV